MANNQDIIRQFEQFDNWEERYRYLIQLGKKLPIPSPEQLENMTRIHGCEVEVRFSADKRADGDYHFAAYSEARIMNGLLYLLLSVLQNLPLGDIRQFDVTALLRQCGIASRLSETRLNGLKHIETLLHHLD
ncbi:SufE family protein [Testudinibacter sp. P80/BLE/0925]|uniref:SufE family protein n=1 Tax=Testudinibacter sp. TW-1 TaxID=3417757 RepID=UPI003D3607F2